LVRRLAPILLLVAFAAMGSGALARLHDLAHAHHDTHKTASHEENAPPAHDEGNCDVHALLRAPLTASTPLVAVILPGLFAAFLTLLAPKLHAQRVPVRIDCRGPPVR
jgi:hypothetical protein